MNNLILRTTRLRAQSRLYQDSCLIHRLITNNEQTLINAVVECENLDELTSLTDELEKLLRNPTELLVQFHLLSLKPSSFARLNSSGLSTIIVTNDETNLLSAAAAASTSAEDDDSLYEFMNLYYSDEVVDCRNMKDAADIILDDLVAANASFYKEENSPVEDEPEQSHRPHLPTLQTDIELNTEPDEPQYANTDMLMNSFIVSGTNVTPRKNKSPKSENKPRTSSGKCDNEKKRGRPPVSPCDKTSKVKKTKTSKKVVNELSDCDE